jgi:hypothetical protein
MSARLGLGRALAPSLDEPAIPEIEAKAVEATAKVATATLRGSNRAGEFTPEDPG